jgi:hypothetical protein
MSLSHIKNRRDPTIFGKDLNVLNADTTINGNVVVSGNINGTSSQGQETNNVWTGTNTYSVERPTCSLSPTNNNDAVNKQSLENILSSNSVITKNATWSGVNTFNQDVVVASGLSPSSTTDAITGQYLTTSMTTKFTSFKNGSNVWTGSNVFSNYIPTRNRDEVNPTDAVTKSYVDGSTRDFSVGNAVSSVSQTPLSLYNFGTQNLAHQIQIIGGGGGSTSGASGDCSSNFAGVSGGSGVSATLFLLTYSPLAVSLSMATNLGRYTLDVGLGGSAGIGCGSTSSAGNGTPAVLYVNAIDNVGLDTSSTQILRANGGFGFTGTCGQAGTTNISTYSNVNSNMIVPYTKSDGRVGTQNGGEIYQHSGYNKYGAGSAGLKCSNGLQGYAGGYTLTSYQI